MNTDFSHFCSVKRKSLDGEWAKSTTNQLFILLYLICVIGVWQLEFTRPTRPKLVSMWPPTVRPTSWLWRTRTSLTKSWRSGAPALSLPVIIICKDKKNLSSCLICLSQQVKDQLPHLKAIVQYKGQLQQKAPFLYTVRSLNKHTD